ncbi:MAG TPA: vWA domain-containing protein [Polyangiaceae bacterium]|nr:vWA domain-containing protein [Polyangiaceae bacterium]
MLRIARAFGLGRWLPRVVLLVGSGAGVLGACTVEHVDGDDQGGEANHKGGSTATGGTGGTGGSGGSAAKGGTGGKSTGSGGNAGDDNGTSGEHGGGAAGEAGAESTSGLKFPITLTPIGSPLTTTAHVSLYFTASDADDEPVPKLVTDQFAAKEDGAVLDKFESAFRVTNPKGALVIPTVLLLDLSRSVVQAGALDALKKAANRIIDSLDPAQRLAIVTFATSTTTRQTFTTDKTLLHDTVDAITMADGVATNLYGALIDGYHLWDDGFRIYDSTATDPQLVAGLMIAISDGSDTAAISTLAEVKQARGTKRTIFIRVGEDVDASVPEEIATAGVITAKGGFDDLVSAVDASTARITKLNDAIYAAEYCSPKRAGSHDLVFTVKGNESYIQGSPSGASECTPNTATLTCDAGSVLCEGSCCPTETPYYCPSTNKCYQTATLAGQNCSSTCIACGPASSDADPSAGMTEGGPAISVEFSASQFSDAQCNDLFTTPPSDGGSGGEGGGPGTSKVPLATACASLQTKADEECGVPANGVLVADYGVSVALGSACADHECPTEYASLLDCLASGLGSGKCSNNLVTVSGICQTEAAAVSQCGAP